MKILCHLVHPAHFHLFLPVLNKLKEKKWDVLITIREKDILKQLVIESELDFIPIAPKINTNNKILRFFDIIYRTFKLIVICKRFKPDIMISSASEVAISGKILRIPSILFFEDDLEQIGVLAYISGSMASAFVCPESCSAYKWENITVKYKGYHELIYLHPNNFKFSHSENVNSNKKKFLIRLAKLTAYHDKNKTGIDDSLVERLINKLNGIGEVYLSAERELPEIFEKYRIKINPLNIFNLMRNIDLYIGDSQTMAAEAAVLGVPAIRFNDFVGKLGYLEELEHKYGLTYGIKTSEPEKLFEKIDELLSIPCLKEEWQNRRGNMLKDKIDVTAFFVWFIENYPQSFQVMKKDSKYQYKFKLQIN